MTMYQNTSLVIEGGTFRTIYSTGVLDVFIDEGIEFPYVVGISAGAVNACTYVAKQKERPYRVIANYRHDKRYMSLRNYVKEGSYFGLDFAYNVLVNELDPFDWESYAKYDGEIELGVTNALTGEIEFLDALQMDRECTMLRATCALPIIFPEIKINNIPYYDGGLADPIPVSRAEEKGYEKHVFVLTRPKGYRKKIDRQSKWTSRLYKRKYPKLANRVLDRVESYNKTMDYIEQLEDEGKAFVFRPEFPLNSFEKDTIQMKRSYEMGLDLSRRNIKELKKFLAGNV
ncbi:MAG TPA: patatin family protein [Niallia sp.]|nr:patatin family protein [Niallia sp.]